MKYIVLNKDKTPTTKLTKGGFDFDEVSAAENLGVLMEEPYVVFDFDNAKESDAICRIINDLDIPCMLMKTTSGVHVWFKSTTPLKNSIKTRSTVGARYDVRSWGKHSYVMIKKHGEWREWLRKCKAEDMAEVPFWMKPIESSKYDFVGMKSGDGRNQLLYEYILVLQSKKFNHEQIREILRLINSFCFEESLPQSELDTICREESFKADVDDKPLYFEDDGKFRHNVFGDALIQEHKIISTHSLLYINKGGIYRQADNEICRKMINVYRGIRDKDRQEVMKYLRIITEIEPNELKTNEYIITMKNVRFDLKTKTALPFDDSIEFIQLPVEYNPDAECPALDHCLMKTFKGDQEVINLFEEMIGYVLMKNCRFRKGFIFYGSGSNGKSTILNMLKAFIGDENYSAVDLKDLEKTFLTALLDKKLANIGDDIGRQEINETGVIKKLFTGESLEVQHKFGQPFVMKSFAKLMFSCNDIPRIADRTSGMYSRLMLIPFTASFTDADEDFDPFIEEKITTPEALSHLFNRALKGLNRLLKQNHFTIPSTVIDALSEYKTNNSTVLSWIADEEVTRADLLSTSTDVLFSRFKDWCNRNDIKYATGKKTFHADITNNFDLQLKRCRSCASDARANASGYSNRFVVKLD